MDQYGQIGPEKGDYEKDLLALAAAITSGSIVAVKFADRLTQYRLTFVRGDRVTFMGYEHPDGIPANELDRWLYVSRENDAGHGAGWFQIGSEHRGGYVAQYLGGNAVDGDIVGDLLMRVGRAMTLTATTQ